MFKNAPTHLGLWLLKSLAVLPLPLIRGLGFVLGRVFYWLGRERRRIAWINFSECFPNASAKQKSDWTKQHFVIFAQALLDRSWLWWGDQKLIRSRVQFAGFEHFETLEQSGQAIILFAPHFQGLDAAWMLWSITRPMVSMYSRQKNRVFDAVMLKQRTRFNAPVALSRQDGLKQAIVEIRKGRPFYYLPDMDFGRKDSLFVPFFKVPAATVPGLPRMARLGRAQVLPCITRMTPQGYEVQLYPPWDNYPTDDITADVRRMNAFIEERVQEMIPQYHWLHKRFKTRPIGESKIY